MIDDNPGVRFHFNGLMIIAIVDSCERGGKGDNFWKSKSGVYAKIRKKNHWAHWQYDVKEDYKYYCII